MAYDHRITDIAWVAAIAAGKNASVAPQLLMPDITFTIVDAVEDGRLILGVAASGIEARSDETPQEVRPEGQEPGGDSRDAQVIEISSKDQGNG